MNLLPALATTPHVTLLTAVAALAYAVLAWAHPRMSSGQIRAVLASAWLLHLLVLLLTLFEQPARFGFAPALSFTAWLVLTVYALESRLYPQLQARWTLAALGAVALLLALAFPGQRYPAVHSIWLPLHWALGIASYGLVAAAVLHAWLMQRAETSMRQGVLPDTALPLLTLERLTFRLLTAGFVLLSATLLAGWWISQDFVRDWMWSHKTAFTALSWLTLALLLWGRWRLGWRGHVAARMLYAGAGLLLLGYVGSRFVLEVLLRV